MKVLIVNNMAPFVWGGAEELAVHLQRNVQEAGHQAEILRIPFQWTPAAKIPSQMLLVRALELWNVDQVIALKFPAYLIRHPRKTFWLLHQYRQAYDLYDAGQSNIGEGAQGDSLRRAIRQADAEAFGEARHIFTNSEVTKNRLLKHNGFEATVLLPPVNDPEFFMAGEIGDYVFAGGRVNSMKRQHLLVEAMAYTDSSVKLVVAGPPDSPEDALRLESLVDRLGLSDRVHLDLRFLPREIYAGYVNGSAAVAYLPFDEDSLGYVAMEAATASRPIITTTDSGGILGLAKHESTGWVAEPTVEALAEVLSQALARPGPNKQYGRNLNDLWTGMGVNWPQTVEALLR